MSIIGPHQSLTSAGIQQAFANTGQQSAVAKTMAVPEHRESGELSAAALQSLHEQEVQEHGGELAQQTGLTQTQKQDPSDELQSKRGFERAQAELGQKAPDGYVAVDSPKGTRQLLTVEQHHDLTDLDHPDLSDDRLLGDIPDASLQPAAAMLNVQMSQGVGKVAKMKTDPAVEQAAAQFERKIAPQLSEPLDIRQPGNDKVSAPMKISDTSAPGNEQGARLQGAVAHVLTTHPEASPERDEELLQCFIREGRSSAELAPFLKLMQNPDAQLKVDSPALFDYKNLHGMTATQAGQFLDRCQPLYAELRDLSTPLPAEQQTMYRWGPASWKQDTEKQFAAGDLNIAGVYATRGLGSDKRIDGCDQAAVYACDNPESGKRFGDTCQTLSLSKDARYLDNIDPKVLTAFDKLCHKYGVYDTYGHTGAREDLYYKAGIDVVRDVEDNVVQNRPDLADQFGPLYRKQGFFKIYDPTVITGVK